MSKKFLTLISILMIAVFVLAACAPAAATEAPAEEAPAAEQPTAAPAAEEPTTAPAAEEPAAEAVKIVLWTKEGEADGGFQWVKSLTDAYTAMHPNVTFEVVNKEVETLREDFQTSSLAGDPPELLWTVNDHAGPFTAAGLIMPVDDLFDMSQYVDSVVMDGKTYAVPISSGNHLMLLYNKDLIAEPPADTDALIAAAANFTGDVKALVYNQTEPFWLVPWLGGFGGSVFAEDGVTPTLNTPEMVSTLQWMLDMKTTYGIVPSESDYDGSDTLFKEGKAAMIINGDWSLGGYSEALGDKLGVAPIPQVVGAGWPAPYTSGTYFMMPTDLEGATLDAVVDFVKFVTNEENQLAQLETLNRLPALRSVLENPMIAEDPILAGSAKQMSYGTPMPSALEMRCNWDAMKPEMLAVLSGTKAPEQAAADMQTAAETCVSQLE
ncbi:extracellular solute-binding protein [Ornatilinea apprima]|uniref:extracellular solute-binding protein n=1 Tax=Ornatilinea apprima TaxID=1134406 RepID=UPI0009467F0E|nr:extracellular solute-binding protein [Ornatilinea apprima]